MSRTTVALDRVVTVLLGLALVAAGILAVGWYYAWWSWLPEDVDSTQALDVTGTEWWPWVLGAAAVVLLLVGLRWLLAHAPGRRVSDLRLPGSGAEGRLEVDASSAVSAACADLQARHDVRAARGVVRRDRGQLVIEVRATLEPRSELREVASAVDHAATALTQCLERPDLYCRVRLDVGSHDRGTPARVR